MTSAVFSCDIAMSTAGSTTSPTSTEARPEARARIFCATVMPMCQTTPFRRSAAIASAE